VNFSRLRLGMGIVLLLGIVTATAGLPQIVPPGGVIDNNYSTPTPVPAGGPRRGKRAPGPEASGSPSAKASPSDTPEPPQFTTVDGIWEVEAQPLGKRLANYTHLSLNATGPNIIGYWQTGGVKAPKFPVTGTFDGRLISLTATMADGSSASFSGYVENFGDMVGILRRSDKDPGTAFTAEHRKKLKG
jgi:hypothetical protein